MPIGKIVPVLLRAMKMTYLKPRKKQRIILYQIGIVQVVTTLEWVMFLTTGKMVLIMEGVFVIFIEVCLKGDSFAHPKGK